MDVRAKLEVLRVIVMVVDGSWVRDDPLGTSTKNSIITCDMAYNMYTFARVDLLFVMTRRKGLQC
jgi:hypothetical protein